MKSVGLSKEVVLVDRRDNSIRVTIPYDTNAIKFAGEFYTKGHGHDSKGRDMYYFEPTITVKLKDVSPSQFEGITVHSDKGDI
jgi:hypothetical protein